MTRVTDHKYLLSFALLALVVFSACSFLDALPLSSILGGATQTPTPTNTRKPTLASSPTPLPPTPTLIPETPTPTETKAPTARPTRQLTPSLAPSATLPIPEKLPPYACDIYSQTPPNYTIFPPNEVFDGRWVVKNTGSTTWDPNDIEFKFISGTEFQRNTGSFIMPKKVKPGVTIDLLIDMAVPAEPGEYKALWGMILESNTNIICAVEIIMDVR